VSALESLSEGERGAVNRAAQPRRIEPMKATLTDDRFSDPDWIFERKLDGVRCLVFRTARTVHLRSRTDHLLDRSYPELVEALEAQQCKDFVADGEIVAFAGRITSFSRLQGRMQISDPERARRTGIAVYLYLFDLLHLDGHDVTALPLRSRKRLLASALSFEDPIRRLAHRNRDGERLFADGGFTAPKGSRTDFGALLVGYDEDGRLRYAGKVGTGFDRETLRRLGTRLRKLERERSPFAHADPIPAGTRWVEPRLVGEFAFSEWTRDGRLRHPRYLGLRDDKRPSEVVREASRPLQRPD
jgi:bifunctional non-homologous end joining protein LigD